MKEIKESKKIVKYGIPNEKASQSSHEIQCIFPFLCVSAPGKEKISARPFVRCHRNSLIGMSLN